MRTQDILARELDLLRTRMTEFAHNLASSGCPHELYLVHVGEYRQMLRQEETYVRLLKAQDDETPFDTPLVDDTVSTVGGRSTGSHKPKRKLHQWGGT